MKVTYLSWSLSILIIKEAVMQERCYFKWIKNILLLKCKYCTIQVTLQFQVIFLTHFKCLQYEYSLLVNHLFCNEYSVVTGEGGRLARTRTLSQSSYTDPNETNMIIFQQPSPLHPTYWTPAPTPGDSAASSVANTPVLQRKRRDSKVTNRTTSVFCN